MKRRPAKFENVPELLTLFGEAADLRPPESFAVARPAARHHTAVISASPELRAYVASLADRADRLREVDSHDDNMLKICSDGRKAALDLELVGITPARPGKVAAVIANVARIHHDNRNLTLPGDDPAHPGGGFQIVFCDLGTPSAEAGPQVYGKIRAGLVEAGVPAAQIRFIHDATSDIQKATLFADCRAGKVAVLLGSTDKLGVGTNIQTRCVALHHVDAPWRPADVEQREGRALRPGNLNPTVDVYRYVTEKSFDSFMWQTLERKARFIGQVLGGRPTGRDVDDIGDSTLSYAEVKALATGNPLLMELAEANAEVMRLRHLATGHVRATRRLGNSIASWEQQITGKTRRADTCERIAAVAQDHSDPAWYDQRGNPILGDDVAAHLARLAREAMASTGGAYETLTWRGLHIHFTAGRKWRQIIPVATISARYADLSVELNAAWTAKGQYWRIEKEIKTEIDGTAATAERLHSEINDLRQRIADATRRINEPFPHAAELEAARVRRDAIEQDIRDAAAPQDDDDPAGPSPLDDLVLAGMEDTQDVVFTQAMISPAVGAGFGTAADETTRTSSETAEELDEPLGPELDPEVDASAADEPEPISRGTADEPQQPPGPEPVADTEAMAEGERAAGERPAPRLPYSHPVLLARLDSEPEALFPLPPSPAEAGIRSSRPRRTRPKSTRRRAAQIAAHDLAAQPTLFDLPPTDPEPARARVPARTRPRISRK